MGLNCLGPLTCRFFSKVNATVLHGPRLVESMDVELWVLRAKYKLYTDFSTAQRVCALNPRVVQGSTVITQLL